MELTRKRTPTNRNPQASAPIGISEGRVLDGLEFLSREIVAGNALLFRLLYLDDWVFLEPIIADAELKEADQAFMLAAGGVRAIAPRCTFAGAVLRGTGPRLFFEAFGRSLLPAPRCASLRWCEGARDLRWACPESTWGNGIAAMRCRFCTGIFASGGCRQSGSFSLPLGEMLRFLS